MKTITLLAIMAWPMMATVIVSDPTMAASDYSGATAAFPFGAGGSPSNASFGSGGNPGAYRSTNFTLGGGGAAGASAVGELNVANVWNFATQGVLNTLSFRIDNQVLANTNGGNNQLLFGVRQGGTTYYNATFSPMTTAWQTSTRTNLTQANFGSVFVTGAPQPNFAATSGILEVGYFVSSIGVPGTGTFTWNTDNFCVIGNGGLSECNAVLVGTPEPASLALMGSALLALGVIRRRRK